MKTQDALDLLFAWPSRHALHLGLPLGLLISAFLHVVGLGLFRLREPTSPRLSLRPATVAFLPPGHPASESLKIRGAMADPALFSPARVEEPPGFGIHWPKYRPSFQGWSPVLAPAPVFTVENLGGELLHRPVWRVERKELAGSVPPSPPTSVSLEGELAGMSFEFSQPGPFVLSLRIPPSPSEWLVAIGEDGRVVHDFLLRSSGDEQLDRAARLALRQGQARPKPDRVRWGVAVFNWGGDLIQESAQ